MPDSRSPKRHAFIVAITVGAIALVTALLGLAYNAMSLFAAFGGALDQMPDKATIPYFETAFYLMSGICVACYLAMVYCAVGLFRRSRRTGRLLTLILLFEVGYFFAVGSMWREPTVGSSVAAATGVANGGMMVQFLILFPIWAPLALWALACVARHTPRLSIDTGPVRQASIETITSSGYAYAKTRNLGQPIDDTVRHRVVSIIVQNHAAAQKSIYRAIEYTYVYRGADGE